MLPHINDTFLLAAAIYLATVLNAHPFNSVWITAKIFALIVYIVLGIFVIKGKGSVKTLWFYYGAAITVFAYIIGVAVTKNPLIFI